MKTETGYIKLYRQTVDWEWYRDGNTARVFLHLLLSANFAEERLKDGYTVKRGEILKTQKQMAKELGMTVREVQTSLKHLKKTGEISIRPHNRTAIITVTNFETYQGSEKKKPQKKTDTRIPEMYRSQFSSYEEYVKWRS